MQIVRHDDSETNIKLTITATPQELKAAKQTALTKLSPQVKLSGFRPGHAPAELVEKQLDQSQLQTEVINEALNLLYPEAVKKENLRPVNQPKIAITKFVPYTQLEFTAEIEIVGKINLPNYKGLKITKKDAKVGAKDVEEVLTRLQNQMAEYKEEDRASKKGDRVWIDFAGKDQKGQEVKGASGKEYPLMLGSDTFIPGFEDNLIGLKKGDKKEFTITFPKDYGVKALQGKKVTFSVDIKKVESATLPKVDADFAKKVGNFTSVDDLKSDIKKQVQKERESQAERDFQDQLIKRIVEKTKMALPQSMLDEQAEVVDREFKQNLVYRGQTFNEYLETNGLSEDDYRAKELMPAATERLKAGLVLSEIADREKVTITPEELEIRMQVLKGQYQSDKAMQDSLEKPEARRDVAARLLTEKTINKLVDLNK